MGTGAVQGEVLPVPLGHEVRWACQVAEQDAWALVAQLQHQVQLLQVHLETMWSNYPSPQVLSPESRPK